MTPRLRLFCSTLLCGALLLYLMVGGLFSGCAKKPMSLTSLPGARAVGASAGIAPSGLQRNSNPALNVLPSGSEELWILALGGDSIAEPSDEAPGTGALMAKVEEKQVPM